MLTLVTKKGAGSSELTIQSLEDELGDGIVFLFGGMTDESFAAQDEMVMVMVMKYIDKRAKEVSAKSPGILLRISKIEGLSYDHSGCFRETCIRTCQMHNFERVLVSLFSTLMGSQGLAYG